MTAMEVIGQAVATAEAEPAEAHTKYLAAFSDAVAEAMTGLNPRGREATTHVSSPVGRDAAVRKREAHTADAGGARGSPTTGRDVVKPILVAKPGACGVRWRHVSTPASALPRRTRTLSMLLRRVCFLPYGLASLPDWISASGHLRTSPHPARARALLVLAGSARCGVVSVSALGRKEKHV